MADNPPVLRRALLFAVVLAMVGSLLAVSPASAVEGGSTAANTRLNRSTVRITTIGSTCSGVLIAPDLVLTARHCIRHDIPNPAPHPPRAGFQDWELPERFYDFRHVLPNGANVLFGQDSNNPVLAAKAFEYSLPGDIDIAMLRLTQPVPKSVARPVDVVTDWGMKGGKLTRFLAEQEFRVFGFGKTSADGNFSNIMQEGRSNRAAFPCPAGSGGWTQGDVHRMCLKGANGTGVRSGDSGGPAYWFDANGKRHLVAIFQGLESFHNGGRYETLWYGGGRSAGGARRGDTAGWIDNHLGARAEYGPVAIPVADFDGDRRQDIVRNNGIWYVAKGIRRQLATAQELGQVRVGNFDDDRADELFWSRNGQWTIENLDGSTKVINQMNISASKLRFADLNGDKITDVLYRDNAKKRLFVSWSGTTSWQPLRKSLGRPKLSKLRAVAIGNDGVDDLFKGLRATGIARVSHGGGGRFVRDRVVDCGRTRRLLDFHGTGFIASVRLHC